MTEGEIYCLIKYHCQKIETWTGHMTVTKQDLLHHAERIVELLNKLEKPV